MNDIISLGIQPVKYRSSVAEHSSSGARRDHATASVGVPEALQTMKATLRWTGAKYTVSFLAEHVRLLTERIEEKHREVPNGAIFIRRLNSVPRVCLAFESDSATVRVDKDLLDALGRAARAAYRIYLHSHCDAYVASEAGTALAIRRAVEVRSLLISLAAPAERIRLFYRGPGDFIVNNSTVQGKAVNRRVEIEFRQW
jgi:outer membrane protein OmpA-like peptidoglycan-associated protein